MTRLPNAAPKPPRKPKKKTPRHRLVRTSVLKRGKPPRVKGKPRFKREREPAIAAFARTLHCSTGCWCRVLREDQLPCAGRTEAAHLKSRGAGGKERDNVLSLCTAHHREQHTIGWQSFSKKYWGADDMAKYHAEEVTKQFDAQVALGWEAE